MKVIKSVLLSSAVVCLFTAASVMAESYPASMEDDLVAVCKAVKSNNQVALRRAVKHSRVSLRELNDGLVCNGKDMLSFAQHYQADGTAAYIVNRTLPAQDAMTAKR